jgi:hypothetical protein
MSRSYVVMRRNDGQRWQEVIQSEGYKVGFGGELTFFNLLKDGSKDNILTIANNEWTRVSVS